jgi:VanZ family protein
MGFIKPDGHAHRQSIPALLLTGSCVMVLSGILLAGLWPFHTPKNEVSWVSGSNGLLFGHYGSLLSVGAFTSGNSNDGVCVEIWLAPTVIDGGGTILSFYSPSHRSTSFALRQSLDDVALLRKNLGDQPGTKASRIYADHVFRYGKPVFITISSGQRGTSIYVNGVIARMSRDFRFSSKDLTGQLVVGNSSLTTDTWSGELKGLVIYSRELTASQVVQNYLSWVGGGHPGVAAPDAVIASYLFSEGVGNAVHNSVDSATDLIIPDRFFVLHEPFLERPWNEYHPGWSYWMDISVNIAGFVPLGFLVCAYFSTVRGVEHPAAATIAFGFAVSLTIEVLQAFLPTRNSGMTDLITNTFGTALGAMLCAWGAMHSGFAQKYIVIGSSVERTRKDLQLVE